MSDKICLDCKVLKQNVRKVPLWQKNEGNDSLLPSIINTDKYNPKKSQWNAPYPCGMNINNFDMIILKTLNERYNISKLFNYETFDLRERLFTSLIWDTSLKSRSMDNIRKHFGMSSENAHDALQDVKDTAKIIQRFLKHDKNLFDRTRYKGCMESVEI